MDKYISSRTARIVFKVPVREQKKCRTLPYIPHDSSRPPSTKSWRWPHKSPVPSSWNCNSINMRCTFSTHIKACGYMREFTCYLLSTANRIKGQVHKSIVFERSSGL